MKNQIDFFTATDDFDKDKVGQKGTYHWSKFKKYFKTGNTILIRNKKKQIDILIKLTSDPIPIPIEKKDEVWYSQGFQVNFVVIEVDYSTRGKSRQISKQLKKEILDQYKNKCPGLRYHSEFSTKPKVNTCNIVFDNKNKPEFDHIIEYSSQGGLSVRDNLIPLCKGCHAIKSGWIKGEMKNRLDKHFRR